MKKLVLASASARRREMLSHLGLDFTVFCPDADEVSALPDDPGEAVEEIARRKANAASVRFEKGDIVIASDTVVCHDGHVLTKPRDAADAEKMLSALSGACHKVYSGLCVTDGEKCVCTHSETLVRMREISGDELDAYIESGEPFDKAGGYGIQDLGGMFVERIEGDYYNVVGMPLEKLCLILRKEFDFDVLKAVKCGVKQ